MTRDALMGALKTVQREWIRAMDEEDKLMSKKWGAERERILALLATKEINND